MLYMVMGVQDAPTDTVLYMVMGVQDAPTDTVLYTVWGRERVKGTSSHSTYTNTTTQHWHAHKLLATHKFYQ